MCMQTTQKTKKKQFKPFIKRVWGKRQLLSQMEEFFPKFFQKYYEPFAWWGAVFFHLRSLYGTTFSANLYDINNELINTYNTIKHDVQWLIDELKTYEYDKDFFLQVRERDREPDFKTKRSAIQRAARFIYMNRSCFNGLYRVNSKWQFNVPFGKYSNPQICDVDTLLSCHEALQNTIIRNDDFENVLEYAEKWDLIYLDPPYDTLSDTANFTSYNESGFGKDEQVRLFEAYQKLDKKWCFVMLSNHNTPFINELYKDYNIKVVYANRAINSNGAKRGKVEETVILNY